MYTLKPLNQNSRRTLELLREPGRVSDLSKQTGWSYELARARLREMKLAGYLDELGDGLYRTNQAGLERLKVKKARGGVLAFNLSAPPQPFRKGRRFTPEAIAWLERNYPLFGHIRCAEKVGMNPQSLWKQAQKLGLEYGNIDGHVLITEAAKLLGGGAHTYTYLWAKARRAGVLRYPPGAKGRQTGRKAMVPIEWLEAVDDEHRAPERGLVRLESALLILERRGVSVGKTSLTRTVARLNIETPTRKPTYGPPCRYVTEADLKRLVEHLAARPAQKNTGGQARVLELLNLAGEVGMTEKELEAAMGCSRAAVRFSLAKLAKKGHVSTFEPGNTFYPNIYRAAGFSDPPPFQPGRYPASPLSWVGTLEAIRLGVDTRSALSLVLNQSGAVINNYLHDLMRWGLVTSQRLEGTNRKRYTTLKQLPA